MIEVGDQTVSTDFALAWKGPEGEYQIEYSYTRAGAPSLKLFRGGQLIESDAYPSGLRPVLQQAIRPEGALYKLYHAMIEGRLTLEVMIDIITRNRGREEGAVH